MNYQAYVTHEFDLLTSLLDNKNMKKELAISIFGTGADLGRALGMTRQAIAYWPQELTIRQQDEVIGAAIRLNKISPEKAKELINDERERNERSQGAPN